jgi:thiol-disulfide isomerase/thioredoxin
MKRLLYLLFAFLLSPSLFAQGITFFEGSWDEAVKKAAEEEKFIFVDAYTTWCGPCKWMDANVFNEAPVADFIGKHFIAVKLDMEKEGDGKAMAERMQVRSYPTFLFFNSADEPVHRSVGGRPADEFIELAREAMDPARGFYALKAQYADHLEEGEWLLNFAVAASNAGESGSAAEAISAYEKVTQEEEWQQPENWKRLVKVDVPFNSEIFRFVLHNRDQLRTQSEQPEAFDYFLFFARRMFVVKSAQVQTEAELQPHFETIQRIAPADLAPAIVAQLHARWYEQHEPEHAFEKVALYLDQFCDNSSELNAAAWNLVESGEQDMAKLKKGLAWIDKSIALDRQYANLDTRAWLLHQMGKSKEAKIAAEEAIAVAKENGQDHSGTDELLEQL